MNQVESKKIGPKHTRNNTVVIGPISKAVQVKGPSINEENRHKNHKPNRNMAIKGIYSFPITKNIFLNKVNYPTSDMDEVAQEMPSGKKNSPFANLSKDTNVSTNSHRTDDSLLECNESISDFKNKEISETIPCTQGNEESTAPIGVETLNYLVSRETNYLADAYYIPVKQIHVNKMMRAILFDWMMEVCNEYQLKRETFYLSANYVDRYLSKVINIPKQELQLVGVTSLYMASKMEEIYPPKITDYVKSTDDGYKLEQIMTMEINIAKVILLIKDPQLVFGSPYSEYVG
jgi:hypothetical protein